MQMYDPFTDANDSVVFRQGPMQVVIDAEEPTRTFLQGTGFDKDGHDHHEVCRQIFDTFNQDLEFDSLMTQLRLVPNFSMLNFVDQYFDYPGEKLNNKGLAINQLVFDFAVGIYMVCHSEGIFIYGNKTAYILETIRGHHFLLHNKYRVNQN